MFTYPELFSNYFIILGLSLKFPVYTNIQMMLK